MKIRTWALLCSLLLPGVSFATAYTPLAWQGVVDGHANPAFNGQRKHLSWVRDLNRNFVDDEIEKRFKRGDRLDVILQLNHCLMPGQIEELVSGRGTVQHVGQLITFVVVTGVLLEDLPALAERPDVAMIEWRAPDVPEMDTASRAIQARSSSVYSGLSAEDGGFNGTGINIAVVDGGVDDGSPNQVSLPSTKFVAGVDVTDPMLPTDGTHNPVDAYRAAGLTTPHGSLVAAIAMGERLSQRNCRAASDNTSSSSSGCGGIAPGARLVDVKMCSTTTCSPERALDWIGTHAKDFNIRIVLYAYTRCGNDDGNGALAQQANYLSALGILFVAAYGNAPGSCMPANFNGERVTKQPASGSFVLSVAGSETGTTANRNDDSPVTPSSFIGPRLDWSFMTPNLAALKPDLAAPQGLTIPLTNTVSFVGFPRSSPATAVAAGAAALLLQRMPNMSPESVKQALITAADNSRNTPFSTTPGVWGRWDATMGWGLLNIGRAIDNMVVAAGNPRFANCNTPSIVSAGQLCSLRDGLPVWNNITDIDATTMPRVGAQTTIRTHVINSGNSTATFTVNFGVYIFSGGNNQFHHIGSKEVTLAPGVDSWVTMEWTPAATNHQCIQVSIVYGSDQDYTDNVTQRNFQVLPSQYTMRVENPLFVPAKMEVVQKSQRAGWQCDISDSSFTLDPFKDCARNVTITFNAPKGAKTGELADCDVAVYATPLEGEGERRLVGGVTVRTFVPKICKAQGQVVDIKGRPIVEARVRVSMVPSGEAKARAMEPFETTVYTDAYGVYTVQIAGDARHTFTVEKSDFGRGEIMLRPGCGLEIPRLTLSKSGLEAELVKYERAPL